MRRLSFPRNVCALCLGLGLGLAALGCTLRSPGAAGGGGAGSSGGDGGGTESSSVTSASPGGDTSATSASGASSVHTGGIFVATTGGRFECDVWIQDCHEGEKCMPYANDGGGAWNDLECVPLDPNPKGPDEPCTVVENGVSGIDDCEKGAMCWNVDPETKMGWCIAFCTGSPEDPMCEDPKDTCIIANGGVLILCIDGCDPLIQDCTRSDVGIPNQAGDDFVCVYQGQSSGGAGSPCRYASACPAGMMCAEAGRVPGCPGGVGCCAPFCDLSDPDAAATCDAAYDTPGATCVPFFAEGTAPPDHENVGVCLLAP